ncbi:hypothetical protein Tco_1178367, partial [Tanacetum coccineum]
MGVLSLAKGLSQELDKENLKKGVFEGKKSIRYPSGIGPNTTSFSATAAKSTMMKDQMRVLIKREVDNNLKFEKKFRELRKEVTATVKVT